MSCISISCILGRPTLFGKALSFTRELSFLSFLFYQSTALSSHAVDGHHMYFGGSVVGKAGIEISPTPTFIYTGGSKVRNLGINGKNAIDSSG